MMMTNPFEEEDLRKFLLNLCPTEYQDLVNSHERKVKDLENSNNETLVDLKVALTEGAELYYRIKKALDVYREAQFCILNYDGRSSDREMNDVLVVAMYTMMKFLTGQNE